MSLKISTGEHLGVQLCQILGIDLNRPHIKIKSVVITATAGEPAYAVVTFLDEDVAGEVIEVIRKLYLTEESEEKKPAESGDWNIRGKKV